MRVTVLTGPWFPVPAVRGGAMSKSWHALSREMVRAGQEVTLVARSFPGQPATETIDGVHLLRTRGFSQGKRVGWDLVKDLVYALNVLPRLPSADILVTNDFWLPALAATFRRPAGAVVVSAARFPKGQYRLYRRAARVVAISGAVKAAIVEQEPAVGGRTVVIPLPVDLELFRRAATPHHTNAAERTLLYVGRVHPEKGLELLLRAFARLTAGSPKWRLAIVGPVAVAEGGGGEGFLEHLRGLAQGQKVEFHGPVFDPEALATIYRGADLFCYPSLAERGEAFGVAALEAMAAGVPPVVSNLACFRDFVRDGENGWVFDHRGPAAEGALAGVLERAMANEPLRRRSAEAASREADRFDSAVIAGEYLGEFERILSEVRDAAQR